jgi:hypothetical protein
MCGWVGEKIHNNKITGNWRRFADRNKEKGNKARKKETYRRERSLIQDTEHKKNQIMFGAITVHRLSNAKTVRRLG